MCFIKQFSFPSLLFLWKNQSEAEENFAKNIVKVIPQLSTCDKYKYKPGTDRVVRERKREREREQQMQKRIVMHTYTYVHKSVP